MQCKEHETFREWRDGKVENGTREIWKSEKVEE
jgi:hypothetical protein